MCTRKGDVSLCGADLVPREAAEAWLKHLREELPTVAFKCSTQKQREHTGQRRAGRGQAPLSASADHGMSGGACLGADMLLQLLKKYSLAAGMKQAITVGEPCMTAAAAEEVLPGSWHEAGCHRRCVEPHEPFRQSMRSSPVLVL